MAILNMDAPDLAAAPSGHEGAHCSCGAAGAIAQTVRRAYRGFRPHREKILANDVDCFAAESAVWMVAHYIDSGIEDYSVEAAMSKVFASEALQRSAYEGLQIAAAAASCATPRTSRSPATAAF